MVVEFDGRGPLKSEFNCCIGCVAFISFRAVETRFTFIANLTWLDHFMCVVNRARQILWTYKSYYSLNPRMTQWIMKLAQCIDINCEVINSTKCISNINIFTWKKNIVKVITWQFSYPAVDFMILNLSFALWIQHEWNRFLVSYKSKAMAGYMFPISGCFTNCTGFFLGKWPHQFRAMQCSWEESYQSASLI